MAVNDKMAITVLKRIKKHMSLSAPAHLDPEFSNGKKMFNSKENPLNFSKLKNYKPELIQL